MLTQVNQQSSVEVKGAKPTYNIWGPEYCSKFKVLWI